MRTLEQRITALIRSWQADVKQISGTSEHNRGYRLAMEACAIDLTRVLHEADADADTEKALESSE